MVNFKPTMASLRIMVVSSCHAVTPPTQRGLRQAMVVVIIMFDALARSPRSLPVAARLCQAGAFSHQWPPS